MAWPTRQSLLEQPCTANETKVIDKQITLIGWPSSCVIFSYLHDVIQRDENSMQLKHIGGRSPQVFEHSKTNETGGIINSPFSEVFPKYDSYGSGR